MSQMDQHHRYSEDYTPQPQDRARFYSNNLLVEHDSTESSEFEFQKAFHNFSKKSQNCDLQDENFIIEYFLLYLIILSVRPKKKTFCTPEEKKEFICEYSRKIKTELCKNFQMTKSCKFGDKCSFAHGYDQLQDKQHLHSNYRTKPCSNFLYKGYCQYGFRCQYMHYEVINKREHREYVDKIYKNKGLYLPPIEICGNPIKRFKDLRKYIKFENKYFGDQCMFVGFSRRLPIFEEICHVSKKPQLFINSPLFNTQDPTMTTAPSTIQQIKLNKSFSESFKADESEFSSFFSVRESDDQQICYQQLY